MATEQRTLSSVSTSVLSTNKVLKNTYILLSVTLLFSAATAWLAKSMGMPFIHPLITLGIFFGLIFGLSRLQNSVWSLPLVFILTGFLGATLGPILNVYMSSASGESVVMMALGGTGAIFLGLSGYVLTTRKDFSFMGGFLVVGALVAMLAMLANLFFQVPAVSLTISAVVILLMSGFILFDTSRIIHGGETNYVMATVSLYLSIYNIFVSLLQLLGFFSREE